MEKMNRAGRWFSPVVGVIGVPRRQPRRRKLLLSPAHRPQWTRCYAGERRRGGHERRNVRALLKRQRRPGAPRRTTRPQSSPVGAPRSPQKRPRWRTRLVWVRLRHPHSRTGGHNRRCRPRPQCRGHIRLPPHYRGSHSPPPALDGPLSERRLGQVHRRRGKNQRLDRSSRQALAKPGPVLPTVECIGTSWGTRASSSGRPSHLMQRNGSSYPILVILVKHFNPFVSLALLRTFIKCATLGVFYLFSGQSDVMMRLCLLS